MIVIPLTIRRSSHIMDNVEHFYASRYLRA